MTPIQSNDEKRGGQPRGGGQGGPGKRMTPAGPGARGPTWKYPERIGAPRPSRPRQRRQRSPSLTFGQALLAELQDLLQRIWYYIYEHGESILKGIVCGLYLVLLLLLQTTFFVEFRPFGAVPDLLLSLTVAVAVAEGEKWGAVFGLVAAYFSQAIGGAAGVPALLPLLYMPAGYFCGICAKHYLSDSIPVRGVYIGACGIGRGAVTAICAAAGLNATMGDILLSIVIPEFFSTAVMAPAIYGLIYISLRPFHKSRAERTEN